MAYEPGLELQEEVVNELVVELSGQPTYNKELLVIKVKSAIREVKQARMYTEAEYTDEQIKKDLGKYFSTVKELALYDYSQIGAPHETSHTENSTSRTWTSREKILSGVRPLAKVV